MKIRFKKFVSWICLVCLPLQLTAHDILSWPAEPRNQAERLFNSGPDSIRNHIDWSGAHWNPQTKQLWLCRDNGEIRIYQLEGDVWSLEDKFEMTGENFEGITQVDLSENKILVINESDQEIQEYTLEAGVMTETTSWDVRHLVDINSGLEGIVFIPDSSLENVFITGEGQQFIGSTGGLGGLIFLAYQETGNLFALDLDINGSVNLIGTYDSHLTNTRGLEFDQSTGLLYAIDRDGFVALKLSSSRVMDAKVLMDSPGPEGVEGLALTPSTSMNQWLITTDDDNDDKDQAVLQYKTFIPIN